MTPAASRPYRRNRGGVVTETGNGLAETFVQVAGTLLAECGEQDTLDRVVQLAVHTVSGCDYAGISLTRGDTLSTPGGRDVIPGLMDAIEDELGDGPRLTAIRDRRVVHSDDLTVEDRWPGFAHRAAAETGVRSVLAFPLFTDRDSLGALTLYSRRPVAFGARDREVGVMFAAHAAVALVASRMQQQVQDLEHGLVSRGDIGQAIGIVMVQSRLTSQQAFDLLRHASQRENLKLRDLATRIITAQEANAHARAPRPNRAGGRPRAEPGSR